MIIHMDDDEADANLGLLMIYMLFVIIVVLIVMVVGFKSIDSNVIRTNTESLKEIYNKNKTLVITTASAIIVVGVLVYFNNKRIIHHFKPKLFKNNI